MLYLVFSILVFAFFTPEYTQALESGVGVTPSRITVEQNVEWPYTVPVTVTNFSSEEEQFEVFGANANPGRFSLGSGESRRVLVTFEGPKEGVLKVLSMKASQGGVVTGTGMKIPFEVASQASWGSVSQVFAGFIMLLAISFLWYLANYASA